MFNGGSNGSAITPPDGVLVTNTLPFRLTVSGRPGI